VSAESQPDRPVRNIASAPNDQRNHSKARDGTVDPVVLKLEEFLPYRLNVCASLISHALSRIYAERYKTGNPEWRVLVTLGQFDREGIGTRSHMRKTKVSRAVALLEGRKLIARRANRADLREAFLSLTATGRQAYRQVAPIALEFARDLLETVDAADRAALDRALIKLTERSAKLAPRIANGRRPG